MYVTIEDLDGGGREYAVSFPYDLALKDLVKSVPQRRWNPGTKMWMVGSGSIGDLMDKLDAAGHTYDKPDGKTPKPVPAPKKRDPGSLEDFFDDGFDVIGAAINALDNIPERHHGAVFRAIAKILYPDMYRKQT